MSFLTAIALDINNVQASDIVGYLASVCLIFGYLPQAIYTMRTRKTDDIAMGTFLLMGIGALFFAVQGIMLGNVPLLITNIVTFISSAIIFGIKMYNDYFRIKDSDRDSDGDIKKE